MTRQEALYHEAAMLPFSVETDPRNRQLLIAALYRIEVALGIKPLPASESDLAADAYEAMTSDAA